VLGGLCQEAYSADLLGFRLLGLLQLDDLPALIGKSQFMAEPFALANDGLSLGFTFLVELVYILDRAPVGDVPRFALPEETVQYAAAS